MPSSKGEPTDPELREKIKEEVKAEEKGIFGFPIPNAHSHPVPHPSLPSLNLKGSPADSKG